MKKHRNDLHSREFKEVWGGNSEEDRNFHIQQKYLPQEIYPHTQENMGTDRLYTYCSKQKYGDSSSPILIKQNYQNNAMHNGQYCDNINMRSNYQFNRNTPLHCNGRHTYNNSTANCHLQTDSSYLGDVGSMNSTTVTSIITPSEPTISWEDGYRGTSDNYTTSIHRHTSDTSPYMSSIGPSENDFLEANWETNGNKNGTDPYFVIKQVNAQKLRAMIFQADTNDSDSNEIFTLNLRNHSLDDVSSLRDIVPNVISCDLSANNITSLNGIPIHTTRCYCSHNSITSNGCHLKDLSHLEFLDISANCIGPDLSFLKHSLHLRVVNLSHNDIESLEGLSNSWVPMKELDLSYNRISGIVDFKDIINRSVRNNSAQQDDKGWFSIEILNLSDNEICQIKNISYLPSLKVLNLNGNPIESIIETSKRVSKLERLYIKGTSYKLQNIKGPSGTEIPYPFLVDLQIDGFREMSKLNTLPTEIENLGIVDCFKGYLPKWKLFPKSIKTLNLEQITDLSELPTKFSSILPNLETLNLANNNLNSCHNILSTIPIRNLTMIDLRGNPVAIKYEIENQDLEKEDISEIRRYHNVDGSKQLKPNLFNLLCLGCPKLRIILLRGKDKPNHILKP
ncbi:hypothetical protein C6P45_001061 [Maudiozyma exigua]|uniref:Uncharacterized protein n=1 Tax=Maudiozyma exigua TaxID=34358 RepID=A0A9P6W298_MAUEX|nr:hypothetical protein C6P45_001061 [Kazachstania exigua]